MYYTYRCPKNIIHEIIGNYSTNALFGYRFGVNQQLETRAGQWKMYNINQAKIQAIEKKYLRR